MMKPQLRPSRAPATHSFVAARDGSITVEFALLSTVLIAIFAAILDLSFMVGTKRDAERISTLMTRTLSSCPPNTTLYSAATWKGTDCVTATINLLVDRMPNVLVTLPTTTQVGLASFQRAGSSIQMCPGNMTYLPANMNTSALSLLRDKDVGVLVYIQTSYRPLIPQSVLTFATSASTSYSQYTIDVRGNDKAYACYSAT